MITEAMIQELLAIRNKYVSMSDAQSESLSKTAMQGRSADIKKIYEGRNQIEILLSHLQILEKSLLTQQGENSVTLITQIIAIFGRVSRQVDARLHDGILQDFEKTLLDDYGIDVRELQNLQAPKLKEVFLKMAVNINAKDKRGYTAAMCAVEAENLFAINTLIAAGADLTLKNLQEETALDIAQKKPNNRVMIDILQKAPAVQTKLLAEGNTIELSNTTIAAAAGPAAAVVVPSSPIASAVRAVPPPRAPERHRNNSSVTQRAPTDNNLEFPDLALAVSELVAAETARSGAAELLPLPVSPTATGRVVPPPRAPERHRNNTSVAQVQPPATGNTFVGFSNPAIAAEAAVLGQQLHQRRLSVTAAMNSPESSIARLTRLNS